MSILRHLLSILLLPFMVTVILPRWILTSWAARDLRWMGTPWQSVGYIAGTVVFAAGFALFVWCVLLFARVGQGTLAPWDPTQKLVAVGPYRYMRNPMITGVATMLVGETLFFGSALLAGLAILFIIVNQIYFLVSEEPGLERRFGASYADYRKSVPRWLPRRPR